MTTTSARPFAAAFLFTAAQGFAASGTARFSPGGQPAAGLLKVNVVGVGGTTSAQLLDLAAGGSFTLDADGDTAFEIVGIELVTAAGAPGLSGSWSVSVLEDGRRHLDVRFPDAWLFTGRFVPARGRPPLAGIRAAVAAGSVAPSDVHEAETRRKRGEPAPAADELVNYGAYDRLPVAPDGRFGPLWLKEAQGYRLVAGAPRAFKSWTSAPPRQPFGSLWNAGDVVLEPATGVEVEVRRGEGLPEMHLKPIRVPDGSHGSDHYAALRAIAPELAEAVFGEGRLAVRPGTTSMLAPLPDDPAIELRLETGAGIRGETMRVALRRGEIVTATLDALGGLRREDHVGATLEAELRWSGSEAAVAGASVTEIGTERSAVTDARGLVRVDRLPPDAELTFVIEAPSLAGGRREYRTATLHTGKPERQAWTIEPDRRLVAWGLTAPPGLSRPLAFALERRQDDGSWVAASASTFHRRDDAVEVVVADADRTYRVAALWTPVLVQHSAPVFLASGEPRAECAFEPLVGTSALSGVVVSAATGQPVPGAVVHVGTRAGGVPPWQIVTDDGGRFTVASVGAPELLVIAEGAAGAAETVVRPASAGSVRLELK